MDTGNIEANGPKARSRAATGSPTVIEYEGYELRFHDGRAWRPVDHMVYDTISGAMRKWREVSRLPGIKMRYRIVYRVATTRSVWESENDEAERTAIAETARQPEV